MNFVILGAGKVGQTLIENLIKEKHNITVIDINAKKIESIVNKYDVKGIVGSGISREILFEADVDKADFFIACTFQDELNVICCVLAKKIGATFTIARVRDPEYYREISSMKEELSIDAVLNPEFRTAREIAKVIKFPSAIKVESFANGRVSLAEFPISLDNEMIGKSVQEIVKSYDAKVIFAMVKRGDEVFVPAGDFVINAGDSVSILSDETKISAFCKKLHMFKSPVKNMFIVGGGKIGYYLALEMRNSGVDVKIMEFKEDRCKVLADLLPEVEVLLGDGSDQSVLDEVNLANYDATITLTGIDEENAMISLYAKQLNVRNVITKVDRQSIYSMCKILGLDSVVSPNDVVSNYILRNIRTFEAEKDSGLKRLYRFGEDVEAIEFIVKEDFAEGKALKEMKLEKGIIIGAIVRKDEYVLPTGDSKLLVNDKVIVITKNQHITELKQILK